MLGLFCFAGMAQEPTPWNLEVVEEDFQLYYLIDSEADLIWLTDTANLDYNNDGVADFDSTGAKWDANYRLTADIIFDEDSSAVDWNNDGVVDIENSADSMGLRHIGGWTNPNGVDVTFTGFFDGQYHSIWNVYKKSGYRTSMFADLYGTRIENLRLLNYRGYATGGHLGGIATNARFEPSLDDRNIFRRCWVEGKLIALSNTHKNLWTGGIVSRLETGEISECISFMTVTANQTVNRRIGGLVGQIRGETSSLKNSYAICDVTGAEQVGVLGGRISIDTPGNLAYCYSAGTVTGPEPLNKVGNFAGLFDRIAAESCYWDTEVANDTLAAGGGDSISYVSLVGLTTEEFGNPANFEGWDFEETWVMGEVNGVERPVLAWERLARNASSIQPDKLNQKPVHVYPNPVSNRLIVEYDGNNERYTILNILGQELESGIFRSDKTVIDMSGYRKGYYLLKIENGPVQSFIKQ